jgi:tetratricopeptide (TPR) repeat protein
VLMSRVLRLVVLGAAGATMAGAASDQAASKTAPPAGVKAVQRALSLAEKGRCKEALPDLKRETPRLSDKQIRYRAAMAEARCAMSLDDTATTTEALLLLQRDFPDDPEVLYISSHYFSELANQAAQHLTESAPNSPQLQKLNAEALESAAKWNEAVTAYRKILEEHPSEPEIHYRIARILLDQSSTGDATDKAKAELNEELRLKPNNAAAEFILGEIGRRAGEWDTAVEHFTRAAQFDLGFSEAYLARGMSLASAGKFAEAIPSLQTYVKMQPKDPAGHYQLAIAYSRTGDKAAADHEMELQRQAAQKTPLRRAPTAPPPQ